VAVIAGVFALLWVFALATSHNSGPASQGKVQIALGNDRFDLGDAAKRASTIASHGPTLYPDLLVGGTRYIWVNHSGTDALSQPSWHVFAAVPPGSDLHCAVQWKSGQEQFVDPCTGKTYPADGTGLTRYQVSITPDSHVIVDLHTSTTSTTAGD
jgi:hypothetical protein